MLMPLIMSLTHRLPKTIRLSSSLAIEDLFKKGRSFHKGALKFYYVPSEKTQVLFIAPKRVYKKAVDRNRAKRLLREAFRTADIIPSQQYHLGIMIIRPTELAGASQIKKWVIDGLTEL